MRFVRTAENLFGLPLGFTRVEYLESTGTQYIDTGYKPNSNTKVEARFKMNETPNNFVWLFHARNQTVAGDGYGFGCNGSGYITSDFNNRVSSSTVKLTSGTIYNIVKDKNICKVNDITLTNTNSTFTINYSLLIFALNDHNSVNASIPKANCYYFRIYDNGVLVRDFIPCIDPLGVPCMYDLVGKKPYYNQGTGTVTAGRQVIPVDYLQSTGTQYIDTGYAFTDNFAWEIDFEGILDNTTLFGGRTSSARTALLYQRVEGGINVTTCPIAGLNGANTPFQLSDLRTGRHTVKMAVNANKGSVWEDGVQLYNETSFTGTYISGTTQALFADNFGSSVSEYTSSKVYALKMWQGSNLVRDFIPCKDENNVGYMFDTLTGTVYLNAGTGAFSVGENKYTSKLRLIKEAKELPDGYKRVEYLQSDGSQYIDTEYTINTATDEVLFNFQMISTTKYQWLMGEHDDCARFGVGVGDGTNLRNIAYGATTYKVNDTEIYNSIHYFKANSNGVYLNGTQVHGFETFSSSSTVYLFKLNFSGANGAAGKIWRYVQKRNGALIRDMIPCLDPNNTPCMVDLVSGGTYYNLGTGEFTYGHIITPVEYLESTGTQYIDTGYVPSNTTGQYARMRYTTVNNGVTFGGMISGNGVVGPYFATSSANVGWWIRWGTNEPRVTASTPTTTDTYEMYLNFNNDRIARVDNIVIINSLDSISGNYPSLTLFRRNYSSGYAYLSGKIFSYKITEGTEVVRSFIPVRDENNVGYMFDEVTGQLFGNAGSGSFEIGNDLTKPKVRFIQDVIPSDYLPLSYLESTGTQYINTGIYPAQLTKAQIDMQFTSITKCSVLGSNNGASQDSGWNNLFGSNITGQSTTTFWCQWGLNFGGTFTKDLNRHTHIFERDGNTSWTYTVDTTSFTNTTGISTQPTNNQKVMYLFACNNNGVLYREALVKIYSCTIWDNGVPVRDLYPALRKSDNKPGMYDRITKQFFTNDATSGNDFNYG